MVDVLLQRGEGRVMKRFIGRIGGRASICVLVALVSCGRTPSNPILQNGTACGGRFDITENFGVVQDLYKLTCEEDRPNNINPTIKIISADYATYARPDKIGHRNIDSLVTSNSISIGDAGFYIKSTGVGSDIPQNENLRYQYYDFTDQKFANLKPLVDQILQDYGNPQTQLGQLRVLRDWVARIAIHPYPPFHKNISENTETLPENSDWSDVDSLENGGRRWIDDTLYWDEYQLNGYNILNKLINFDGTENAPMMEHVSGSHYRIRNMKSDEVGFEKYRFVLCTFQSYILMALAGVNGIHGTLISATGHDVSAFYVKEFHKWIIIDPSYNEDHISVSSGQPASPEELYVSSTSGEVRSKFVAAKINGPSWAPNIYVNPLNDSRATYLGDNHANGMTAVGSNLYQSFTGVFKTNLWQYDAPIFYNNPNDWATSGLSHRRRSAIMEHIFPDIGVSLAKSQMLDSDTAKIELESNLPHHIKFERLENDGTWAEIPNTIELNLGESSEKIRSVDNFGVSTQVAEFKLARQ